MLGVQSPTTRLCVSPPAQGEGKKERKGIQGESHRRNNYTASRGNGTCVTRGPGRTGNEGLCCSLTCQRCSSISRHREECDSHGIKGLYSLSLCCGMDTAKVPQHPQGHKRMPRTPVAQGSPLTFGCTGTPERTGLGSAPASLHREVSVPLLSLTHCRGSYTKPSFSCQTHSPGSLPALRSRRCQQGEVGTAVALLAALCGWKP